jgi:hypothetical protein
VIREVLPEVEEGDSLIRSCIVEMNADCKGWHYAWVGSRYKSAEVGHVFAVTVVYSGEVLHTSLSPAFRIASSRRLKRHQASDVDGDAIRESVNGVSAAKRNKTS